MKFLRFLVILACTNPFIMPVSAAAQTTIDEPSAAQSRDLRISPAIFEAVVEPGQTVTKEFNVSNTGNRPLPLQLEPGHLNPVEEIVDYGKVSTFNAASWLTVDEPYHILETQASRPFTVTITAPDDAEPGGHYASVNVEALEPVTANTSSGASITTRVGVLLFITIPGPAEKNLVISDQAFAPRIISSESVSITPHFINTGTIHVTENTKAVVRNLFGSVQAEIDLPPRIILPNTNKQVSSTWNTPLFGAYIITIEGTYGPSQQPIKSTEQLVIVFRWLPIVLWGLPVSVLLWIITKTRGRWRKALDAFRRDT